MGTRFQGKVCNAGLKKLGRRFQRKLATPDSKKIREKVPGKIDILNGLCVQLRMA